MKPEPFLCTILLPVTAIFCHGQDDWDTLLVDGFNQGSSDGRNLDSGWTVRQDNGNYYLNGTEHGWARCKQGQSWTDYSLSWHQEERSDAGNPGGIYVIRVMVRYNQLTP
jgi:hypothetical protein